MNETYTDLELKNSIQDVLEYVARAFRISYGDDSLEIKIKLPKKRIEEISNHMVKYYEKSGMKPNTDLKEAIFTKFKTPQGQIEFIDNGQTK